MELVADIVFHSTFPDRELEREKEVIVDEINTYKDAPAELIYDTFEDLVFEGSELGHNILGRKSSLMRYTGDSVRRFVGRTYTTDQMVFSSIGSFSARTAENYARRYLGDIEPTTRSYTRQQTVPLIAPFERIVTRHTHQSHCILGGRAYELQEEKRLPLSLLINRLGGPCANSILNVEVREKHGLTYNIEANYTPYSDAGVVAIYFSSDHHHTDDCLELIHRQIEQLRKTPFSARQMAMAKRQFIAQMAISCENKENYILGAGKAILSHGEMDTMEEAYRKIQALTARDLQEVAEETFQHLSILRFK